MDTTLSPCRQGQGTCFTYCNVHLKVEDPRNVPCGAVGRIDLTDFEHDTTVCGNTPLQFELLTYDDKFYSYAALDASGVLDWTVICDQPRYASDMLVRVTCGDWGRIITVLIETDSPQFGDGNLAVKINE